MRDLPRLWRPIFPIACWLAGALSAFSQNTSDIIIDFQGPSDFTYLNDALNLDFIHSANIRGGGTIIANVEAGHIWYGHEAFVRPASVTQPLFTFSNTAANAKNEVDFHATAVGNVLGGYGYVSGTNPILYTYAGHGIAPEASLWSGAIATEFSSADLGGFSTTTESTLTVYKAFFNGIDGKKPDVINSSWGGDDPAGNSNETIAIDALARKNPTVTFVVSAGNSGTATVGGPATGYNNISVGSIGGSDFLTPSEFSSRGPADFSFHNPSTGETITGTRAAVDIAAPGEHLYLAAYLGDSGSIGASTDPVIQGFVQNPAQPNYYFLDLDGTSFSAPIVSGAVALLKDIAKDSRFSASLGPEALDSRVVKSVIMASATETHGWDNGQDVNGVGTIVTTQALDYATGAGALDVQNAAEVLVFGTTDVTGFSGGDIANIGWDLGVVGKNASNTYFFENEFAGDIELTISLNWFIDRSLDETTNLGSELSFADLDLQIWYYADGEDPLLIAESSTLYNNSEFLRINLETPGLYGITVVFDGMVYDLTSGVLSETYGLAWQAAAVPEPTTMALAFGSVAILIMARRKRV